ncbi:MAG: hypothetical protein ABR511_13645 [Acidimicrobiales bacterium]
MDAGGLAAAFFLYLVVGLSGVGGWWAGWVTTALVCARGRKAP